MHILCLLRLSDCGSLCCGIAHQERTQSHIGDCIRSVYALQRLSADVCLAERQYRNGELGLPLLGGLGHVAERLELGGCRPGDRDITQAIPICSAWHIPRPEALVGNMSRGRRERAVREFRTRLAHHAP